MSVVQKFGAWCDKEVSKRRHLTMEECLEWIRRAEEGSSRFAPQREKNGVVLIIPKTVAKSRKHYLQPFSTEGTTLGMIVLK